MKSQRETEFKLIRALISNCDKETQLREFVNFLESPRDLAQLLIKLRKFAHTQDLPTTTNDNIGPNDNSEPSKGTLEEKKTQQLLTYLRNKHLSAKDVEFIIKRDFGITIPSNKEGLGRYIRKVSRNNMFEQFYNRLISENIEKSISQDPWLQEMLNEQERRDDHR